MTIASGPHVADDRRYPLRPALAQDWLNVGDGHGLWYEVSGNPNGMPVVCLHGGPASGFSVQQRRFFNPDLFFVVQFDQRGCGRSVPLGKKEANTTAHLVNDMELLRLHLGIQRWLVAGGSWGASLALAYAAMYKPNCLGLLLRGVFLARPSDLDWFFGGAGGLRPVEFERLCSLPGLGTQSKPEAIMKAYAQALSDDVVSSCTAALAKWSAWECALENPSQAPLEAVKMEADQWGVDADACGTASASLLAKFQLQSHYMQNQFFLADGQLLSEAALMHDLPGVILHGQLDWVCRPQGAWQLHQAWPHSTLHWVAGEGHNPYGIGMSSAMRACADHFVQHGRFPVALPVPSRP